MSKIYILVLPITIFLKWTYQLWRHLHLIFIYRQSGMGIYSVLCIQILPLFLKRLLKGNIVNDFNKGKKWLPMYLGHLSSYLCLSLFCVCGKICITFTILNVHISDIKYIHVIQLSSPLLGLSSSWN